ncbi:hypothetical protein GCM10027169_03600 [Gordonia jinhuaensis]|uniref:ABC-type glycine betaine transport system substrate-binding domain-containing protein n=1 Tax=Gordonia jinhuaensis TaxID=1517702 RepID=A0A916SW35_9ACTN|nr:hypothetical protein GCM10011489_00550 [Gordonia jinhuaensis]
MVMIAAVCGMLAGCDDERTARHELVVGSGSAPADRVAAAIYAGVLRHAGADVSDPPRIADVRALLDRTATGDIDLFAGYSGQLLDVLVPQSSAMSSDDVYEELNRVLPQGVSVGDATPVNNVVQVVVAKSVAASASARSLADCAMLPAQMQVATTDDVRASGLALMDATGCRHGATLTQPSSSAVADHVATGRFYGLIAAVDPGAGDTRLQALTDDGDHQRAQNLVPVFRSASLTREEFKAINRVAGELTTADLATMAADAASGGRADDIASRWLGEHSL